MLIAGVESGTERLRGRGLHCQVAAITLANCSVKSTIPTKPRKPKKIICYLGQSASDRFHLRSSAKCACVTFLGRLATGAAPADMSALAIWFPFDIDGSSPRSLRTLADRPHSHRQCANGTAQLRLRPFARRRLRAALR